MRESVYAGRGYIDMALGLSKKDSDMVCPEFLISSIFQSTKKRIKYAGTTSNYGIQSGV